MKILKLASTDSDPWIGVSLRLGAKGVSRFQFFVLFSFSFSIKKIYSLESFLNQLTTHSLSHTEEKDLLKKLRENVWKSEEER